MRENRPSRKNFGTLARIGFVLCLAIVLMGLLEECCLSIDFFAPHNPRVTDHRFPAKTTAMGHRGAAGLAPENTLSSFRFAQKFGMGFELDVTLCASGEVVVMHDDTLDRTTTGKGLVSEVALESLKKLDAGGHFGEEFEGETIPTLEEVLKEFGGKELINIEIKTADPPEPLARAVVDLVEQYRLEEGVIITSFDPHILEQVRLANSEIIRGQIYSDFKTSDLSWYKRIALRNLLFNARSQPDLLMVGKSMVSPSYLKRQHERGYRVFVWTVNERADMERFAELGVDGIITDRPDLLSEVLKERTGLSP